jgi:hypothetical protein
MTTGILEVALFTARVSGGRGRHDHVHLRLEEGPHEAGEALGLALGQRQRGGEVASLDIVQLAHLVQKALPDARRGGRSAERQESDAVGLARRLSSAGVRCTEHEDRGSRQECASPHSIT